ncbi:MAG: hypothetical protein ACLFM0_00495 [Spirochaetales bacterium]
MKGKSLRCVRPVLFAAAASLVLLVGACEEPSVSIEARLGDFFDDLGDARSDSEHAALVRRHFHPDTENFSQIWTAQFWQNSIFRSRNVSSYSWTIESESESDEYGGTTRVRVGVEPSGPPSFDADFYMKTSGGDQKIRAVDDLSESKDVLIESLPQPLYSP